MKTVKDLNKYDKYKLIQDSQDIEFYGFYFDIDLSDYGCLFVWEEEGYIIEIYGCETFIPYFNQPVVRLVKDGDIVKSNVIIRK